MLQLTTPGIHKRVILIKLRCVVRHFLKAAILLALAQLLDRMTYPVLLCPKLSEKKAQKLHWLLKDSE